MLKQLKLNKQTNILAVLCKIIIKSLVIKVNYTVNFYLSMNSNAYHT